MSTLSPPVTRGERELVESLRRGEESAFGELVESYDSSLLRLAMTFVPSRAVAEEVVQETWLGVVRGIDRFEARSSLKTWLFRILTNTARKRGERERRNVPFSSLAGSDEPDAFFGPDGERGGGHWALGRARATPEAELMAGETREVIIEAVDRLPRAQRGVIVLRDVQGWPAAEVCAAMKLSDGNQRVLLHRARAEVRAALERYS